MSINKLLNILIYNIKSIAIFTISVMVIVLLVLFLIVPIGYTTTVRVLPPEDMKNSGLASFLGSSDVSALIGGVSPAEEISQLYARIAKSRSAAEYVLRHSELQEYYDEEDSRRAVQAMQEDLFVEVTKEGLIELSFSAYTEFFARFTNQPDSINNLSAKISNLYITALDSINRAKLNIKARNSRSYIEGQLEDTYQKLMDSQRRLRDFQEKYKTIALAEQLTAAIGNAAEIKAQIMSSEIQLKTYEFNAQKNSMDYQAMKKRIDVLKAQYDSLKAPSEGNRDYLPAFDEVPDIQLEFADLTREVKIYNEVYLLLQKQFFAESIQENKNVPTIEVLDEAIPSIKPKSPRLVFHTFVSGLLAFALISALFTFKELNAEKLRKGEK
ncbi:MAG: hypothetical protein SCALA702_05040 [Melioribacteraceae bacterium]|nr:MAG: hypothetical protein SCALA702_05040 [Melioribacteraceae bacterium]